MSDLDLKKVAAAFAAQNPGMSPAICEEYCSELNTMLSGVLDKPLSLKSYCDAKILILLWLMAVGNNKKAKQKKLRKMINEVPFAFTLYEGLVHQLTAISKNPEQAVEDQGFETEEQMIEARMNLSSEMLALYKAGKLTIAMTLISNPNLLLSNSGE